MPEVLTDMPEIGSTYGIEDVAKLVSQRAAMRLVEAFPGTVLYIPKKVSENHELLVIGKEDATAISLEFGGNHITVPMSFISPRKRRLLIYRLASENMSRRQIALRTGCTERRVYQILSEAGLTDDRQSSLFDDFPGPTLKFSD
ncbi:helix-turn-helix domain-containing protein [Thalassospira xiamenensis]|uniref:helix-turn-helix domain-containing protein n=1 Tax=Thalassospira xiamenensis TaxID=220697 RepID=UPI0007A9B87C|nr:helix-turn-helix domain-containing protein [Thalassospira xiamenensis]KZB51109.1 hypothetical protein AUP41_08365 [Thalassospira xiamenensis]